MHIAHPLVVEADRSQSLECDLGLDRGAQDTPGAARLPLNGMQSQTGRLCALSPRQEPSPVLFVDARGEAEAGLFVADEQDRRFGSVCDLERVLAKETTSAMAHEAEDQEVARLGAACDGDQRIVGDDDLGRGRSMRFLLRKQLEVPLG